MSHNLVLFSSLLTTTSFSLDLTLNIQDQAINEDLVPLLMFVVLVIAQTTMLMLIIFIIPIPIIIIMMLVMSLWRQCNEKLNIWKRWRRRRKV